MGKPYQNINLLAFSETTCAGSRATRNQEMNPAMPMRLYNASTKHVTDNLWLWIAISAAAMLALAFVDKGMARGSGMGNWIALSGAILGILLMLKSEAEMPVRDMTAPDAA